MTPNDERFQQDRLDEQLAALAQTKGQPLATPASRAYHGLRQFHAAQAEQAAHAIERVRLRLAARATHTGTPQESRREPAPGIVPLPPPARAEPTRRFSRLRVLLSTVAAVLVVGALVLGFVALLHPRQTVSGTPSFTDYAWQIVPSPSSSQPMNVLEGIAFSGSTDGWSVGTSSDKDPPTEYLPLVEHWNGKAWRIVSTPTLPYGGSLAGVVSLGPDNAWAVGNMTYIPRTSNNDSYTAPLIEHWNGHQWSLVKSPALPPQTHSELLKVAALNADDIWAVGWADGMNGLIEHWNGQQWSISPAPVALSPNQEAQLTSIAALAPDDVWIAGQRLRGVEHWDGHRWSLVASSTNAVKFVAGISALSPTDVWEVGFVATKRPKVDYISPPEEIVLEHWNGQQWSIVDTPQPRLTNLYTLSEMIAFGPANIWVFGTLVPPPFVDSPVAQGFIAHWDGLRWSVISNPHPQACTELLGATSDPSTPGKLWMVGTAGSLCREYDGWSASTFIETSM